jgi:hypothetical protein
MVATAGALLPMRLALPPAQPAKAAPSGPPQEFSHAATGKSRAVEQDARFPGDPGAGGNEADVRKTAAGRFSN